MAFVRAVATAARCAEPGRHTSATTVDSAGGCGASWKSAVLSGGSDRQPTESTDRGRVRGALWRDDVADRYERVSTEEALTDGRPDCPRGGLFRGDLPEANIIPRYAGRAARAAEHRRHGQLVATPGNEIPKPITLVPCVPARWVPAPLQKASGGDLRRYLRHGGLCCAREVVGRTVEWVLSTSARRGGPEVARVGEYAERVRPVS